jgi:tubulin monoglycylase TTLL3/8
LKDIVRISVLSAWEKVDWRENSIGLYGFDVIIDSDLKMWLLEINLCPTMEHSTKVTAHLVPKMTDDMIKVLVDKKENPQVETGHYELIYESPKIIDKTDFKNKNEIFIQGKRIEKSS